MSSKETGLPKLCTDRRTPSATATAETVIGVPFAPYFTALLTKFSTHLLTAPASATTSGKSALISFSTANPGAGLEQKKAVALQMLPNGRMDALFEATVQATEEAVVNALVAARTMTGADGHTVEALPHDRLREVLKKYNRLVEAK